MTMQDFVPPTTLTNPTGKRVLSRPVAGAGKGFFGIGVWRFESLEVGGVVKQHTTAGTNTLKLGCVYPP